MKMANMDDYFDVVIVGTGAAGLYCALNLPARYRILLLTKQKADESDSFLAQGGICMQHGEADYRPFFDDTMRAGHYENNPATVDLMIRSSNSIIRDLVRRGVRFARDDHGASLMDAGIAPGPAVGKALNTLLCAVMEGRLPNEKAALLAALEKEGLL